MSRYFFSPPTKSPERDKTSVNSVLEESSYSIPMIERVDILKRAIELGDESSVQSILNLHEDLSVNAQLPGIPMPFLHLAVGLSNNCPEIVSLLLERNGDPNNTTTEDKVSPMHLSVIYDYENVLELLIQYGGDAKILNGDKKSCYDLAKDNVEEEMKERCFMYFYRRSMTFRKSIKPSDSVAKVWKNKHSLSLSLTNINVTNTSSENDTVIDPSNISDQIDHHQNGNEQSDDFITCESDFEAAPLDKSKDSGSSSLSKEESELWNHFGYQMTEDDSDDSSREGKRLSTIDEESAISTSLQRQLGYEETVNEIFSKILEEDEEVEDVCSSLSSGSSTATETSCVDSTPPVLPAPTKNEIIKLQNTIKVEPNSPPPIPVTKSTFQVISRFAQEQKLAQVVAPKEGALNFSSELQLTLTNLYIIDDWGSLKIDLLQSLSTPSKKSKSFYNYLLLDPKIIKKANFSGSHLKSNVITKPEKFESFLKAIFYIGKGCGKRPIQHLVDAKENYGTGRSKPSDKVCGEKVEKILNIWKSGLGVIVVGVFHYSSEREANVNEASMIDAVGLTELSNIKRGSYTGTLASTWSQKSKNQFGSFLLYKSFCAFCVGEHKSFYPQDV